MTKTSLQLPDTLAVALLREAELRGLSASEMAQQAISAYLESHTSDCGRGDGATMDDRRSPDPTPRPLPFAKLGRGRGDNVAERAEEILTAEWGRADRDR